MNLHIQTILYSSVDELDLFLKSYSLTDRPKGFTATFHFLQHDDFSQEIYLRTINKYLKGAEFTYDTNDNVGFGTGHNNLYKKYVEQYKTKEAQNYFLIINPDTLFFKNIWLEFENFYKAPYLKWGLAEFRQFPHEHPKSYDPKTFETTHCAGASMLINCNAFDDVKGFDENFFMYYEDTDLSWRVKYKGYKLYVIPNCKVGHSVGKSSNKEKEISKNDFALSHYYAGEAYLIQKFNLGSKDTVRFNLEESDQHERATEIFNEMIKNGIPKHPRARFMLYESYKQHRW